MSQRKLVVVHDADQDTLSVQLHQHGNVQAAPAVPFSEPLTRADRNELRWYLEDYLSFPAGIYPKRAQRVEKKLEEWGAALFDALFGRGLGRDFYVLVRNDGLDKTGFEVTYRQGRVGNAPWELLYDPEGGFFLVQQFASFSRLHQGPTAQLLTPHRAEDQLHVLLVIARPYGERDVPYRTVARPVMEMLSQPHLRRRIRVEVLRPPTFQRFQQELRRTRDDRRPFHDVVHFDGHGGFGLDLEAARQLDAFEFFKGPHGKLLFERDDGSEDRIDAAELRKWIGRHRVPLMVLNACRSGMEALEDVQMQQLLAALSQAQEGKSVDELKELIATQSDEIQSVAATLVEAGADGVVAMGYIVRARAAAIFMRHFYARLLTGGRAAEAVREGRMALAADRRRPAKFGDFEIQDWLIPVYHQRLPVRLFEPPASSTGADALFATMAAGELDLAVQEAEDGLPASPLHGFLGRDAELLQIERILLREDGAGVEIVGLGGEGKTAVAVGAARWLLATHAEQTRGGVHFHAFVERNERGKVIHPSLAQMLRSIGRQRLGDGILRRSSSEQRQLVETYLQEELCILILDNLEAARGMGDQPALLDAVEQANFRSFLEKVCPPRGHTRLLLTSRRREDWLGIPLEPLELAGLDREASEELATKVLRSAMGQARLDAKLADDDWQQGYMTLLEALGGHPIALQIVLPHLEHHPPETVLRSFEDGVSGLDRELPAATTERERTLGGCLSYSFSILPAEVQCLLPVLTFFRDSVTADLLAVVSSIDDSPPRLQGATTETWNEVLHKAASTGLLRRKAGTPIFQLHPLLPWYLAGTLSTAEDAADLERAFRLGAAGLAGVLLQILQQGGDAQVAVERFTTNRLTLLHALNLSRRAKELDEIQSLFNCLYILLNLSGQKTQAAALRDELAQDWKPAGGIDPSSREGAFWLDLEFIRANTLREERDFEGADEVYHEILKDIAGDSTGLPAILNQLGLTALERGLFDQAEEWYNKSLEISLSTDNEQLAATSYHQLSIVAMERRDLPRAEDLVKKSLEISLRINNLVIAAKNYDQLGMIAQERRDLAQAEKYIKNSIEISLRLDNQPDAAVTYQKLGLVMQESGRLDQAEEHYKNSLEIALRLEDKLLTATNYHQLGMVTQGLGKLDEAEEWYKTGVELLLELGEEARAARTYHQLGIVSQTRRDVDQADAYYNKSLSLKLGLGAGHSAAATYIGLGNTAAARQDWRSAAEYFLKALHLYQDHNDPFHVGATQNYLRSLTQHELITRALLEELWENEMGCPLSEDMAEHLLSEPEPVPASPLEFRQLLAELRAAGLSAGQIIATLEQAAGRKLPQDLVLLLRAQLQEPEST